MSEVGQQLLITLVHGTWPRGLFPRIVRFKHWMRELVRRQPRGPLIFWFEEGSPFLARLGTELGDTPHKITPLFWSGANSIFVRDKAAHALAEHLSAEHAEHPQATQLVLAHSHGGNIALRALFHLHQRDASQSCGAERVSPLVVTLATPFIEVHQADFGRRPFYIRGALTLLVVNVLNVLLGFCLALFFENMPLEEVKQHFIYGTVGNILGIVSDVVAVFGIGWWWIVRKAPARKNRLDALKDATELGESGSAQRLLVIRAVDDEASLTLALGAILNYVAARSIVFVFILMSILLLPLETLWLSWLSIEAFGLGALGLFSLTFMLFGVLMASRSVFGRELAVSPMECQINTQSTPDATGLSKIVTLVRSTFAKSLRHGIYDHEDCAKTISDWVRSQLCGPPVR